MFFYTPNVEKEVSKENFFDLDDSFFEDLIPNKLQRFSFLAKRESMRIEKDCQSAPSTSSNFSQSKKQERAMIRQLSKNFERCASFADKTSTNNKKFQRELSEDDVTELESDEVDASVSYHIAI